MGLKKGNAAEGRLCDDAGGVSNMMSTHLTVLVGFLVCHCKCQHRVSK